MGWSDGRKNLIGASTEYDKKQMLEEKDPRSWCKSVSAFANGIGGFLLFGISNDGELVGLSDAERISEIISTIKTRLDPIPQIVLSFHAEGEKKVVILKETLI